jgi:hypothetical protein
MLKHALVALTLFAPTIALGQTPAISEPAPSQCAPGATCVGPEDMKAFLTILKEKQCLLKTQPTYTLDPVNLVIDRDGRIFFSGAAPHPYSLKMDWCTYHVEGKGKVSLVAAVQEPPKWGLHFRPKAYLGFLPGEALRTGGTARSASDAGLMLDPFYFHEVNLNVHVGFRAVGLGIGVDIFRSFGAYAGYAATWEGFRSNAEAALWFSFW